MEDFQEIQDDRRAHQKKGKKKKKMKQALQSGKRFHFRLRVMPIMGVENTTQGREATNHVSVELDVLLTPQYPRRSPAIKLTGSKGLSPEVLTELWDFIQDNVQSLRGGEETWMFELVSRIQTFLQRHNQKPESFHEMMVKRERQQLQEINEEVERTQVLLVQEEHQKLDELAKRVQEEMRRKEQALQEAQSPKLNPSSGRTSPEPLDLTGSPSLSNPVSRQIFFLSLDSGA